MPSLDHMLLKKILPQRVKYFCYKVLSIKEILLVFVKDAVRYLKYSSTIGRRSRGNLRSLIVIDYHRIEKGLSLPRPKYAFGKQVIENLLSNCNIFLDRFGNDWVLDQSASALETYFKEFSGSDELVQHKANFDLLRSRIAETKAQQFGPTKTVAKDDLLNKCDFDFDSFYCSRYSIRDFSYKDVGDEVVKKALSLAMRAPSVCNRQPWRVIDIKSQSKIQKVCSVQGGSRGFAEAINRLLVIAVDLQEFYIVGERNEAWVDGGIFLQSVLISLHAQGVGACPLNWCVGTHSDFRLRQMCPELEPSCVVIALVGIGSLKDEFKVAQSARRPLEEIYFKSP